MNKYINEYISILCMNILNNDDTEDEQLFITELKDNNKVDDKN
jgi:hypothetical protein